jgi:hypothetical protein
MIKKFILQTLLRCKYHVGYSHKRYWLRVYFWRIESARKFADSLAGRSIVWRKDFKKMYQANNSINFSTHPDAKNFSTNI